jgi:hypothetical protein
MREVTRECLAGAANDWGQSGAGHLIGMDVIHLRAGNSRSDRCHPKTGANLSVPLQPQTNDPRRQRFFLGLDVLAGSWLIFGLVVLIFAALLSDIYVQES